MTRFPPHLIASWALCAALATLGGCTPPPPTSGSRAAQETLSACRQRADDVYARQNRSALLAQDSRDSPGSAAYNSGITTRGLSERYGWDSQVSNCVRNQGAAIDTAPGGTVITAPPKPVQPADARAP